MAVVGLHLPEPVRISVVRGSSCEPSGSPSVMLGVIISFAPFAHSFSKSSSEVVAQLPERDLKEQVETDCEIIPTDWSVRKQSEMEKIETCNAKKMIWARGEQMVI